jgi:hypothetical protein
MSFTQRSQRPPIDPFQASTPPTLSSQRQTQRRELRRRRERRRQDVAIGVFVAILAIIIASGLAVVAIGAAIALLACAASLGVERILNRRGAPAGARRRRGRERRR